MGIRSELTAELSTAFDEDLADAVRPFTGVRTTYPRYRHAGATDWTAGSTGVKANVYNPVTGLREEPPVSMGGEPKEMTYSGRGIFSSYEETVVDGINILATDLRLLALQDEVSDAIKIDDVVNGMLVMSVRKDAVGATWVAQLRKM